MNRPELVTGAEMVVLQGRSDGQGDIFPRTPPQGRIHLVKSKPGPVVFLIIARLIEIGAGIYPPRKILRIVSGARALASRT